MVVFPQSVPCGNSACEQNIPAGAYQLLFPDPTTPADQIDKN